MRNCGNINRVVLRAFLGVADRPPKGFAAQRMLKIVDGQARHGVGHLLMKLRRTFAGCQAILREE